MIKRTQLKNMMKSIYENIYTNKQLNEISNMVFRSNLSEEIPIIDRYERINVLQESIAREDFSVCLLNCSLFLLYNLKLHLKQAINLKEEKYLGGMYRTIVNENMFACYKVITPDKYGDIIRYYIVPKLW